MKTLVKNILRKSPIPLSRNHGYDLQTKAIFRKHLQAESHCVDVGCLKGEILDLMLAYAPNGQHFAFEPLPDFFLALQEKYKGNDHCQLFNYALSDSPGISTFNYVRSNPSYSGLRKRTYDKPEEQIETIEVKVELMDRLIPEQVKIDLIKIDVEGAELQVLQGAKRVIQGSRPLVIFEHGLGASDHYGTRPEMIYAYFQEMGMSISTLKRFLKGRAPLSLEELKDQYDRNLNYYFIAYPE